MDSKKNLLLVVGVLVAAILGVVAGMAVFGGGKETATKAEYQATIVNARDRVDFAFAQITKADSVENLIERLDDAGTTIDDVAGDVDGAAVADGFGDLNADLADKLDAFSSALHATADQFADPSSSGFGLESMTSLGFSEWDDVNAALQSMQKKGLEVELLKRHLAGQS